MFYFKTNVYSSVMQKLQNKQTINTNPIETTVMGLQSHGSLSCMACCIIWLETVKGNYSMIGSYSGGTSIPVKGRGLHIDCLPGQSQMVVGFSS